MNQNIQQQQQPSQPSQPPLSTSTFSPSSTTSSPHSPTSNNSGTSNNNTSNNNNNNSNNNSNNNNNEEPTILQLLISTASSLKRAFPQYKHVTIGDLVFGLVMVAHQHDSHRFYEQELENPKCLKIPPMTTTTTTAKNSLHMWKPHKFINPEHVPMTLIEKSHLLCHYSDLVYYPICHWEEEAQQQQLFQSEAEHQLEHGENLENAGNAENAGNEKLQVEKSEKSERACGKSSNRMEWTHDPNSSETTERLNSILMPHAYLDNGMRPTSYMRHLLYYRSESKHCQQVYMCKLDLNLKSLIVSIRGTKNVFDILTDLSCEASELEAHEFYLTTRQQEEKNRNRSASLQCETLCDKRHAEYGDNEKYDQMIKGTVHGGFVKSATSIFNQMKPLIDALFLNRNKPLLGTDDDTQMMKSSKHTIVHPRLHQEIETYRNEIQSIDLCGHSMGGGVGTILAILLREYFIKQREKCRQSDHSNESTVFCPDIHVTTFGSSALVDAKLSQWSQSFVNSFILGGDIVPRLSLGQSEILRQEVNATNWRDRLQMILSEHERVGYVANKADQWLTSWGLPGIFNTPTSGTNSATSPMSKDANDEGSVLAAAAGPMLTDAVEALTTLEQMPPLVTLFPPGNCYLLVPLRHNATRIDFKQVLFDAIDTRFGGGNSEDMTESDSTEENSSKKSVLERLKTESTPKKKRSYKSWISNSLGNVLRSTASSLIEDTPASHRDTTEQSKYPVRVITRCSPGANKEGFVLRRVDAQHFDKIILSQYMFDDHRLDHMFDAFSCVLSMERRMIEQNQVCLDDNNIDEAQELYVSAKIPSFPQQ